MKINKIQILDIPSPGILGGVYSELICAISSVFHKMGIEVVYSRERLNKNIPRIIFGWYRVFINNRQPPKIPQDTIIFNLSPLPFSEEEWFKAYITDIKERPLIDYSYENIKFLELQNPNILKRHKFNFEYFELTPFKFPTRNNSFLFYGKMNDFRAEKITELKKTGLQIRVLSNSWGFERDIQIGTSKAIVNIPKYEKNILEVYRIWHSLCLGTPVISERGLDEKLANEFNDYILFTDSILSSNTLLDESKDADIFREKTSFERSVNNLINFIEEIY